MPMKTTRPISINNSLVHGICNYSCRLCSVNKPGYRGPRALQESQTTRQLIERVCEAAAQGIHVRYIANAGDGEPTLHPDFAARMGMFGDMLRGWSAAVPAPEVSVVTNGARLMAPGILDAVCDNGISLIISFPTPDHESYGEIMMGDAQAGARLLSKVVPGIERALSLRAQGRLAKLYFHISPPEREIVRRDFPRTVDFLTSAARAAGLDDVELVMFPATSNRAGGVGSRGLQPDLYKDLFAQFNGSSRNDVQVKMQLVLNRFFHSTGELVDLLRRFRFPCLWNANLFIAASGASTCPNDQAVRSPQGHLAHHSLAQLMERKEHHLPDRLCQGCDQSPTCMRGTPAATLFSLAARARLAIGLHGAREVAPAMVRAK